MQTFRLWVMVVNFKRENYRLDKVSNPGLQLNAKVLNQQIYPVEILGQGKIFSLIWFRTPPGQHYSHLTHKGNYLTGITLKRGFYVKHKYRLVCNENAGYGLLNRTVGRAPARRAGDLCLNLVKAQFFLFS